MRGHSLARRATQLIGLACVLAVGCGGAISVDVQVPQQPTRADGVTPALLVASATRAGAPIDDSYGASMKFSTDIGQFTPFTVGATASTPDDPQSQNTTVSFNSGVAKAQLYSVRSGKANVTCTYNDANGSLITKTVQVTFGQPGAPAASIQYLGANPASINLAGSGGVTSTQVTFAVTDASGSPVADGVVVTFELSQNPGGATIAPSSAKTANGSGIVQTVLQAGRVAGTVVITAKTSNFSADSDPIQVSGRGVNYDDFSLACDSYYISGFSEFGLQNNCTVFASDVNGMFVPGTEVSLLSEAGGVPRVVKVNKDPDFGYGRGDFVYQTQCPLPVDTEPLGPNSDPRFPSNIGEFRDVGPVAGSGAPFFDMCFMQNGVVRPQMTTRNTLNPRDGWATLVAYTIGEECYDDKNGDGQYSGDIETDNLRCDLGEPFLDENDNNQWDGPGVDPHIPEGEPFFDYDSNGTWTPPNGHWDQRWPIWRKIIMIWTGTPVRNDVVDAYSSSQGRLVPFGSASPMGVPSVPGQLGPGEPHCTSDRIIFQWGDGNGNCVGGSQPGDQINAVCNGDCIPGITQNLFECNYRYPWVPPSTGDIDPTDGLYLYTVGFSDGDACAIPEVPGTYTMSVHGHWHLSSISGGVQSVNEYDYLTGQAFPVPDCFQADGGSCSIGGYQ